MFFIIMILNWQDFKFDKRLIVYKQFLQTKIWCMKKSELALLQRSKTSQKKIILFINLGIFKKKI